MNFLFWGGRISPDRNWFFQFFFFFAAPTVSSAENGARKKEGWCVLFFFLLYFPFFPLPTCVPPSFGIFLVGKLAKFTAGKSCPAQWRGCTQQRGRHDTMATAACVSEPLLGPLADYSGGTCSMHAAAVNSHVPGRYPGAAWILEPRSKQ